VTGTTLNLNTLNQKLQKNRFTAKKDVSTGTICREERRKGDASREVATIAFGSLAIKAFGFHNWITDRQIESARQATHTSI
jgi:ribosomal protein L16/L10AE